MTYTIRGLSKRYGEKVIFDNRDFTIEGGVTTWISGPSGAGKTTFLRILLSLEKPDGGDLGVLPSLRYSAVFQEYRLCENLSAGENVRLVTDRKTANGLLTSLGLGDSLSIPVRDFSGGMKQRVSLARALAAPYDILVMDEPFTGLDDATKEATIKTVKRLTACRTVLLVTHDRSEAEAMGAERTITME